MLHVILDTSIYSGDPRRNNSAFRALIRLAKAGVVRLHVPEIAKREFTGQQRERIEAPLKEMVASLKKLRRLNDTDPFGAFAKDAIVAAKTMAVKAKTESEADFAAWIKEVNAVECPIKIEDAEGAFDGYFDGHAPFKTIKNRADIPDAFIWQAVKRLAKEHKDLHFVVADNTLRGAATNHAGITTYATLDDFIQTEECQNALRKVSANENLQSNRVRMQARLPKLADDFTKFVQYDMVNALDGKEVSDSSIPDDNNEGLILSVGEANNVVFDFDQIAYYGDDDIGIPLTASIECTLNYAVYKADYYLLDEDKMDRMSIDERNRHYYDVDEEYTLAVKGTLSIKIDSQMLEDELDDGELDDIIRQSDTDVEVDEIEVAKE